MKLYFAAAEGKDFDILRWCGVKKFLSSYFYCKKKGIEKYKTYDLFLDSGAFSSLNQNEEMLPSE